MTGMYLLTEGMSPLFGRRQERGHGTLLITERTQE